MFNLNMSWLDDLLEGMKAAGGDVNATGGGLTTTPRDPNNGIAVNMDEGNGGGNLLGSFLGNLFGGGGGTASPAESGGKVDFEGSAPQAAQAQGGGLGDFLGNLLPDTSEATKDKAKIALDFFGNLSAASAPSEMPNSFLGALGKAGKGISASMDERSSAASNDAFRKAQSKRWEQESDPAYQHRTAMIAKGYVQDPDGTWSRAAGLQAEEDRVAEREAAAAAANDARDHANALEIERVREEARAERDERNAANKPMTPGDKKVIYGAQDAVQGIDQALSNLDRLDVLNGKYENTTNPDGTTSTTFKPGKVLSGATASAVLSGGRTLGSWMPDMIADDETILATGEYDNLTQSDALGKIGTLLSGPTSDRDVQTVMQLSASLDKTPEERAQIIKNSREALQRQRQFQVDRLSDMGAGMPGQNPAAPGGVERAPLPELPAGNVPTISDPNDPWLRDPRNKGKQFRTPDGRLKIVP